MKKSKFEQAEEFMHSCMNDTVHDILHVYRVLNYAVQIAEVTEGANMDVVILAAILHDIGREKEKKDSTICHAEAGSEMARNFLLQAGYEEDMANHVASCILTHRYKKNRRPESIEGEIIFDADKLDLTGTVGTARAILFGGQIKEPLYLIGEDKMPTEGLPGEEASLFREYNRKLKEISSKFYTKEGTHMARIQQKSMDLYFESLFSEIHRNYELGKDILAHYVI
ncbi:MAG: HD domain-containing protein [Acetivibrio sp.]